MTDSDPTGTPPPPRPVWVKVFSLVVAVLGIIFIAVHLLTGGGAQMMNH
ncbi:MULTISPECIES: hypothetical protein [Rathayibacter]|uniref:Uncharacterized protein n=1 Tax=Rathayibacter rubneri TaxID=2950106 RepID=A0A9X2DX27_9MICO|nr:MULTISPECIES: hypothetical protein [Rathayibacter]MCJ1697951.1 hypothetical protein [Rathayibacter caricis]MCM6761178.1 hypothetical protein [Rathayibacter rubneri]